MAFAASATLDSIQLGDSHILSAMLLRINGEWKPATFDLNDCIGNINGIFAWGGKGFSHTASNVVIDMSHAPTLVRLVAALKRFDGSYAASDINLNECIANMDGEFKHILPTQAHLLSPSLHSSNAPVPAYDETPPPERAKGIITTLPPNDTLCTAFVAIFTGSNNRQLRFTACPIIAIPSFSAQVTLYYAEVSEASGTRSCGGSASKRNISLYLENEVRIIGEITQGGPDTEVTIAGSGHWCISR